MDHESGGPATPVAATMPLTRLRGWVFPTLLAVLCFAVLLAPGPAKPATALAAGILLGGVAAIWAFLTGTRPVALVPLIALAIAIVWLGVAAMSAANRFVSLMGLTGQHNGWALWAVIGIWTAAAACAGSKRDLRRATLVVAAAATIAAAAVIGDAAGLPVSTWRFSPEASGVFESSVSVSQLLVLGVGCCTALAAVATTRLRRGAVLVAMGVCLSGIALAGARSAWIALAAGALYAAWALWARQRGRAARRLVGAAAGVLVLATIGVVAYALVSGPSSAVFRRLDSFSSLRLTLWGSALRHLAAHPVLGAGPEQFSAWMSWAPRDGGVFVQGAWDPHNVALAWALGGGLIGLALFLVAAWLLGAALVRATRDAGPAGTLLLAGLAAWGVSLLASWLDPLSAVCAALLAGLVLGAARPASAVRDAASSPLRPALAGLAALLLIALAPVLWGTTATELRWAASRLPPQGRFDPLDAARRTPDPTYADEGALGQLAAGDRAGALDTLSRVRSDAVWHVDVALVRAQALAAGGVAGDDAWRQFSAALADGRAADPASAVWDYVGATTAEQAGRTADARALARAALTRPLSPEAEAAMRAVAGP